MILTIIIFNDLNQTGIYTSTAPKLSGLYVTLRAPDGTCVSQATNINGSTTFTSLLNNTEYIIYETLSNITGNRTTDFFNSFEAEQPILTNDINYSTTSTTPRKFSFNTSINLTMTYYFGHCVYKKLRCKAVGYLVTSPSGASTCNLLGVSVNTGRNQILAQYSQRLNALAYNYVEGFLYSMTLPSSSMPELGLYRIDGDYSLSTINLIIDSLTNEAWTPPIMSIGSCSNDGLYYISYINSSNIFDRYFYRINLNPRSLNYLYATPMTITNFGSSIYPNGSYTIADWIFNNTKKRLYAFVDTDLSTYPPTDINQIIEIDINETTNTYNGTLIQTDISAITDISLNRSRTMVGIYGYDTSNFIYMLSATGNIYSIDMNTPEIKTFIRQNTVTPVPENGDGANCTCANNVFDFGNAPETDVFNTASYKTTLNNLGPFHTLCNDIHIGNVVYVEPDAIIGVSAPDNDGILSLNPLDNAYQILVSCYNNTGYTAKLYSWLDFNTDGIFSIKESVVTIVPSNTTPQNITVNFSRPEGYTSQLANTFLRLRLTTEELTLPLGLSDDSEDPRSLSFFAAIDGEVEDYLLSLENIPFLNCTKSVDKNMILGSGTLTYTILVTNPSNYTAAPVIVKDILSNKCTFISGFYMKNDGVTSTFTLEELTNGINIGSLQPLYGTATFTINVETN